MGSEHSREYHCCRYRPESDDDDVAEADVRGKLDVAHKVPGEYGVGRVMSYRIL
jgi:hypothetical protein